MTATAELVAPRYLSVPEYDVTLGPEVAAVATLAGFAPDPEQRLLLDAAFAIDPVSRKSVAFEVVVIAPRQNLKTGFEKQYSLGQLFVRDERLVVWSAHEFDTAQEALKDIEALIEGSADLSRMTKRVTHGAVPEIETMTGARLKFKTRTSGGGRGLSGRKVILDEGYALQKGQVGALMPIMLAQPDPQVVIGSSACRPESAVLWDIVQRGRAGGDPRMVYAEWCTPEPVEACALGEKCQHLRGTPGCGCDKPELIRLAHSAVTRGRILMETVVDLRKSMPADEYGREVMGWHDEVFDDGEPAVDFAAWSDLVDADASNAPRDLHCFGVEVDKDRAYASICAAGRREDDRLHLELVSRERGTRWVVEFCAKLDVEHGPAVFVIDGGGPGADLIPEFEAAGLNVVTAGAKDMAAAAAATVDGVNEGSIVHGPDDILDSAVRGARKRPMQDGGFAFGRRASMEDVTPLVAASLAGWAVDKEGGPSLW